MRLIAAFIFLLFLSLPAFHSAIRVSVDVEVAPTHHLRHHAAPRHFYHDGEVDSGSVSSRLRNRIAEPPAVMNEDVDDFETSDSNPMVGSSANGADSDEVQRTKYARVLQRYAMEDNMQSQQDGNYTSYHQFPTSTEQNPLVGAGSTSSVFHGDCSYDGSVQIVMAGNGGVAVPAVKIKREHLTNPDSFDKAPDASDNSIASFAVCAFDKMQKAAAADGVKLTISSGFRTLKRQQYFWHCHVTRSCNNGNLAARPGRSNHGLGKAFDLNCPERGSAQYQWMRKNGLKFGFIRTVPTENWHWEYRPGQKKPSYT